VKNSRKEAETMEDSDLLRRMTEVFHDVFDDDTLEINPEMSAPDVEGWDSLSNIRLMIAMESAFKVRLSANEITKLTNVGDLARLIKSKVKD
jgi:acyl carrier protein